MKVTKGEGLLNYLKGLTVAGEKLQTRMEIAKKDQTVDSLVQISEVFTSSCSAFKDLYFVAVTVIINNTDLYGINSADFTKNMLRNMRVPYLHIADSLDPQVDSM